MTLQIGITGGIGSGKSMVAKIFALLGIPIYDADTEAKKLMTSDEVLMQSIVEAFGEASYYKDGSLNRSYLSRHVFNNSENASLLNSLVHPRVSNHYQNWAK